MQWQGVAFGGGGIDEDGAPAAPFSGPRASPMSRCPGTKDMGRQGPGRQW